MWNDSEKVTIRRAFRQLREQAKNGFITATLEATARQWGIELDPSVEQSKQEEKRLRQNPHRMPRRAVR